MDQSCSVDYIEVTGWNEVDLDVRTLGTVNV